MKSKIKPNLYEIPAVAMYKDKPNTQKRKKLVKKAAVKKQKSEIEKPKRSQTQTEAKKEENFSNPIEDSKQTFQWLISPVSLDAFFQNYWEQKPLHLKRTNEGFYSHILTSTILDKIIRNNNLHYGRNIDVVQYINGKKEVYNEEGRAAPSALWDYYANGCSIRVLNPHTYNQKIQLLLVTLQEFFGAMVGANVYLTPPNSQGFAPHFDDIEAFILQVEGKKHWKLYKPRDSDVLARFSSPNLDHKDIGKPFMELTLKAGEMLYFPRGTIHEGYTDSDCHSLHITVSVYQQTSYTDLLQNILPIALKKASENDIEFRQGLPLNYLKYCGSVANGESSTKLAILEKVKKLMENLVEYLDIDLGADLLGKKLMHDSLPPILTKLELEKGAKDGGTFLQNGQIIKKIVPNNSTKIRLLRYYCIRLVNETSPKLYYNSENANFYHGEEEQFLELENEMIPLIVKLQNCYPAFIKISELPMEDDALKMQLISSLWEHDLIITE